MTENSLSLNTGKGSVSDETSSSVQCFFQTACPALLQQKIAVDLAASMPSYRVEEYLRTKASLFENAAITVVVQDTATASVIGVIVAGYLPGLKRKTLNLRTILIAEKWHRKNVINKLLRHLFRTILQNGNEFPQTVAFKTYSPKSYLALSVFSRLPGVQIYPDLEAPTSPEKMKHIREIARCLSPKNRLEENSGVLVGASDGIVDFYSELALCGREKIDTHFAKNMAQTDRLLCCLFFDAEPTINRIRRTFGV